jgi:hypothetical protein
LNIFLFFIVLFASNAFAATFPSYYCTKTFQTVKLGDTPDVVSTACGTPTTTATQQVPINTPITTTQWVYALGLLNIKGTTLFLPTVTVIFDDNQKVIEIQRSNSIVAAGYCSINGLINVGDPARNVLLACGQPTSINTQHQTITTNKIITEWTYNNGPYQPQILFDFEDGKLTQITSGQLGHA